MTVAQGCGCNQRFLNLAANFGHPRAEVIAGECDLMLHSPPDTRLAFCTSSWALQSKLIFSDIAH